ncbi:HEPN domain-containing protein [Microvirgula aerodenitrificans]|uniref:HEPN domain-containing protein n=1 Tax=Microvirgula aerodenitrificans TaxID=57480 RepID=UPI0012EB4746|nr:HEPN domain-containing protein [Microvirgula aerodenitrificans]
MLHRERDRIARILELGKTIPLDETERIGHWSRYACIACAGYIEVALRLVLTSHVQNKATREICSYVVRDLDSIQNPKAEKFINTLRYFSDEWGREMDSFFLGNQQVKSAIDSLMSNRHLIAHGRTSSISLARVTEYFSEANKAIDFIDEMLNLPQIPKEKKTRT